MERGGQVFYLHNRVEDMERTVSQLEELVPDASIGYAHGQMTETQLENVIYDFLHGAYDVLVTTTIIETGVDMPNANTLIIENADHYGLSSCISYADVSGIPAVLLTLISCINR